MNEDKSSANNQNMIDNSKECCLWNALGTCSLDSRQKLKEWSNSSLLIYGLTKDMTEYLQHLNVIPHNHYLTVPVLERDLILNRLYQYVDVSNVDLKICPLHRYTFGVGWRVNNRCYHTEHSIPFKQSNLIKRRRSTSVITLRVAPFHLAEKILGFPYGGKICDKHRKQLYVEDTATVDDFHINYMEDDDNMETNSSAQSFVTPNKSQHHQAQRILVALEQSTIKSHSQIPLLKQTPGAVRRLAAKLRKAVATATTTLAQSIAPGQANFLINLAGLDTVVTPRSSSNQSTRVVDENFLSYLVDMYRGYEEKNLPYNEKIRLLALIPDNWNLSYDDIINRFGCSQRSIKTARSLKAASSTPLHVEERPSITRQRYDPAQIDHFLSWLIETKLLVSVAWGNTHMKLENGNILTIPRQVLQAKRSHAIHQYKIHCSEVNFQPLGDRKLLYILESMNTRSQKAISGMDDFAKAAGEGWDTFTNLLSNLPIHGKDKTNLLTRIENSCLYLKTSYSLHCTNNNECTNHCAVFALSDAANQEFFETCKHKHDTYCKECLDVVQLFDDLEILIEQEQEQEKREELKYDFNLARESIFEMFRHRIRTFQQDTAKSRVLASMSNTTAFQTIDWAQKILPQGFREGQTAYFGKKGMSALVGSFTFYDTSDKLITRTYILCLTRCDQTEQATLSGGYLISKQFRSDYPHINSLIKRSDNASILAGHATPEGEWYLSKLVGLNLLMRDYSEIQSGKDICDRIVGAAKMRMKAYLHAGHDVTNASQIKHGMEYCGGVKNVKIATAEMLDNISSINSYRIADISMIRNIVYDRNRMILRKASEIGPGRAISFSALDIPINMQLVESFEPSNSNIINNMHAEKKDRTDRKYMSFFFCSNDECIESFQSEDDLIAHEAIDQHTTKDNHFSANDTAKILLFDKMRGSDNAIHSITNTTTTTTSNSPIHLPKHFSIFERAGWALRTHKPSHRINKAVKEYVQKIYEEEKINGRKIAPEEYLRRIRLARSLDGTKLFIPSQYLTISQVRTQIRQLAKVKSSGNRFDAMSIGSVTDIRSQDAKQTSTISSSSARSSRSKQTTQAKSAIYFELDELDDLSISDLDDEDCDAIDSVQQLQNMRDDYD